MLGWVTAVATTSGRESQALAARSIDWTVHSALERPAHAAPRWSSSGVRTKTRDDSEECTLAGGAVLRRVLDLPAPLARLRAMVRQAVDLADPASNQ